MKNYISTLSLAFLIVGFLLFLFGLKVIRSVAYLDFPQIQKQEEVSYEEMYSLVEASALGNLERVRRLVGSKNVSPNIIDPLGRSPLRAAIESGHIAVVKYLLDHGANVNDIDLEGNSALLLSVRHQRVEVFTHLLEKGAGLNYRSKVGRTALYEAALVGNYDMVDRLIRAGADTHVVDVFGNTILHAAVMSENIPVLRKVIATTVDIDTQNEAGITALGLATSQQLLPQVEVLLENKASVSIKDYEGQNALQLAVRSDEIRENKRKERAREIESVGKDKIAKEINEVNLQDLRRTQKIVSAILGSTDNVNRTLVNTKDNYSRTPLMYAAMTGNFLVIEELLKAGANINMQDENGMTALHHAIQEGYSVIVEDLLLAGANLEIKNKQGRDAVQLAHDLGQEKLERMLTKQAEEVRSNSSEKR